MSSQRLVIPQMLASLRVWVLKTPLPQQCHIFAISVQRGPPITRATRVAQSLHPIGHGILLAKAFGSLHPLSGRVGIL